MDEDDFLADLKTQRAVVMSLMIVREAASRVLADHPEFAQSQVTVPWRSIRGMRNRIAHGYFDIDLHVVWQTVAELPALVERLVEIRH
ncbi:HepT-like ribonuclease domain-containing protein [Martelella soudanensis]|uniref:HepT-like ribonuclease domain-containing protein n=1 Tax=unclassified Martelella TaxID=2629616 RepID=UPI0015DFCD3C|nr:MULTISPECIES: HepT-like ribonuclease domain-containing protein [unclassified Martelella]